MRRLIILVAVLFGIIGIVFFTYLYPRLAIANGFSAKAVCSCVFISKRNVEEVIKTNLYHSVLPYVNVEVNDGEKSVEASFFGFQSQTAVYKEGVGCILKASGKSPSFQYRRFDANIEIDTSFTPFIWTEGRTNGLNSQKLQTVVSELFDKEDAQPEKRTSAVLVIHKDTLVAEKYAKGFDKSTPQAGWSMTKSLMNTFVGLMVHNGKIDPSNQNLFGPWQKDERSKISLHDLLQMQSGLEWEEDYTKVSDVTRMLYEEPDMTSVPIQKKPAHSPGSHWVYSSGTTNLISGYLRNQFANDEAYHSYLYRRLFATLNMTSFVFETDVTGTYIGSSYGWATPRDWATFGRLYLHNGVWQNKQLLPDYWVKYTTTPAEYSNGQYGAHFWLNHNHSFYKDVPADMYFADGYQGQFVFIIPSLDLIVVRLGSGDKHIDVNQFLKEIISCLPR